MNLICYRTHPNNTYSADLWLDGQKVYESSPATDWPQVVDSLWGYLRSKGLSGLSLDVVFVRMGNTVAEWELANGIRCNA